MSLTGNFTTDLLWIIPIHILPSPQVSSSKSIIKRLSGRMPAIKVSLQLKSIQVPPHLRHVVASGPLGSPHAPPELSGPWGGRAEWLTSLRRVSCHSCYLLHDFIFFSLRLCNLKKKKTGVVSVVRCTVYLKRISNSCEILRELTHKGWYWTTKGLQTSNWLWTLRPKWGEKIELRYSNSHWGETQNSST